MDGREQSKFHAAQRAIDQIRAGMVVGLGSGSTTKIAIELLGSKVVEDGFSITAVSSSRSSSQLAQELGITVDHFTDQSVDIYIDGADEVDPAHNLIKGGGGALLREKVLAFRSDYNLIIVDDTKMVPILGRFPLPIEINQFGSEAARRFIEFKYGIETTFRGEDEDLFITDNGNLILDCAFKQIDSPKELNAELQLIPGVVETGIFSNYVDQLIVGSEQNIQVTEINPIRWPRDS